MKLTYQTETGIYPVTSRQISGLHIVLHPKDNQERGVRVDDDEEIKAK